MSQTTTKDDFNVEVIKLMIQLAWSDGRLHEQEKRVILGVARSWSVPEPEFAAFKKLLSEGGTPAAPDLALLRRRPDEVFEAVQAIIMSDGKFQGDEKRMLEELRIILSPSP